MGDELFLWYNVINTNMAAQVKVLVEGFTDADSKAESGGERTCATISLVRDGDLIMVVDPGVLESQQILIDALQKEGLNIGDVNMVCITHSHIDHYGNVGMFPNAKILEYFGLWDKGACEDWQEQFTPNIQILRTPGHDYTGITLFVTTEKGVVAVCGDVFWKENYPEYPRDDAFASDHEKLERSRESVLKMADWIIPGHAGMHRARKATKGAEEQLSSTPAKPFGVCRKCKRTIENKLDSCRCRPHLCHHCCECGLDCDLCGCSHKK